MDLNYHVLFRYALISGIVLLTIFTVTFAIAQKKGRWVILDSVWGVGFVITALIGWVFSGFEVSPKLIILLFVAVWGIRLSVHVKKRTKKEDARYEKLKGNPLSAYFTVFLSQGLFTWIMCLPFYFYFASSKLTLPSAAVQGLFVLGLSVCLWGLFWEWTADAQLKQHIRNSPGVFMRSGLWAYSRHPNYFGEICFWWGLWFTAQVGISAKFPHILITMLSPLTITWIISKVTGPMLEEIMKKYPEWEEYKRNTPYIVPKISKNT